MKILLIMKQQTSFIKNIAIVYNFICIIVLQYLSPYNNVNYKIHQKLIDDISKNIIKFLHEECEQIKKSVMNKNIQAHHY